MALVARARGGGGRLLGGGEALAGRGGGRHATTPAAGAGGAAGAAGDAADGGAGLVGGALGMRRQAARVGGGGERRVSRHIADEAARSVAVVVFARATRRARDARSATRQRALKVLGIDRMRMEVASGGVVLPTTHVRTVPRPHPRRETQNVRGNFPGGA